MRVLVLSDSYPPQNVGGAGEVAGLVSEQLAARGNEVLVLTAASKRGQAGTERIGRVTVRRLWAPVPRQLRLQLSLLHPVAVYQVWLAAKAYRPDVVHAHNVHERLSFGALAASRRNEAPLVLTAHDYLLFCLTKFLCSGGDVEYRASPTACVHCRHIRRVPARNALVHRMVRRNASAIACISRAQRTALVRNGFADVPLEVVYNGLDPQQFTVEPGGGAAFRAARKLDDRPLVLFGGRISGAKGGDQLLRAMVQARRRVSCQLAILGDREAYFVHARRLAQEVGLEEGALHTLGWLEGAAFEQAFAAASVCATPSVYPDPFNLMTLRAMGHAKPVVGTSFGATPELVVDGETGYLANPWQPERFGERLADLLLDPALAERMGRAGRRRMEEHFTLDRQVNEYLALYEHVQCQALPVGAQSVAGAPATRSH